MAAPPPPPQQFNPAGGANPIVQRYHTPGNPEAFSAVRNVAQANHVPENRVAEALIESESYGLHRQYRRPARRNPYFTMYRRQQCQLDLIDVSQLRMDNLGYSYLVVMIDCFSRKVWLKPVRQKSGSEVVRALREIFHEMGELPEQIVCDRGREFIGQEVQNLLASRGVPMVHPNSDIKAGIVERVNRSLQSIVYKYMTQNKTSSYHSALDALVASYNDRPHRSIAKYTPNQAELEENKNAVASALREHYSKAIPKPGTEPKFKIGQMTRIKKNYGAAFPRGYKEQFSTELFNVKGINWRMPIPMYKLWSLNDRDDILGGAYKEELQRVPGDALRFTILRRKMTWYRDLRRWVPEMLVRWKGPDGSSHDQWVREDVPLVGSFRVPPPPPPLQRPQPQGQPQPPLPAVPPAVAHPALPGRR